MFQFSTRTLFVFTAAIAGLAWIYFAPPQWVGTLALYMLYLLLPAVTLAGIVYHRGAWQAFFIGCAPWVAAIAAVTWYVLLDELPRLDLGDLLGMSARNPAEVVLYKLGLTVPLAFAAVSGVTAVVVRAWAISLQPRRPTEPRPIL